MQINFKNKPEPRSNLIQEQMNRFVIGIGLLVIFVVGLLSYYPAVRIGFVNLDWYHLELLARYDALEYFRRYWEPGLQSWYRPLFGVLFFVVYQFFGAAPAIHYLSHLILHLANGGLLCLIVIQISRRVRLGILSGLLFVSLPIYSKAVYWQSSPDPLAIFFCLLAVWGWIKFLREGRARAYAFAFLTFILALLSKEIAVMLLPILFVLDRWILFVPLSWSSLVRRYFPFAIALIPYALIEFVVQKQGAFRLVAGYGLGNQIAANFFSSVAALVFPWGVEPLFKTIGTVVAIFLLVMAIWRGNKSVAFLVFVGIVGILPVIPFHPDWFELRYLYGAGIASAIGYALALDVEIGMARRNFASFVLSLGAIIGVIFLNYFSVSDQVIGWNEIARQRAVPFRDMVRAHPTFPANTYIYFLASPIVPVYDLAVMFLLQYGKGVIVESADNRQPARWREFEHAYFYYFDANGRPVELAMDRAVQVSARPSPPIDFSAPIRLEDVTLPKWNFKAGESLVVLLTWRALGKIDADYTVFVHLINDRSEIVAQEDAPPRGGAAPTSGWESRELVIDAHLVSIPAQVSGKDFQLEVGLYSADTLERLTIVSAESQTQDRIVLGPLTVEK